MRPSNNRVRVLALGVALAALLSACSDYLARRDTITLNGGDALKANQVTQMVDPWPRASADKNIAFNGERMQRAVERYRTNRVIPPHGAGTSAAYGEAAQSAAGSEPANTKPLGPTVTQAPAK